MTDSAALITSSSVPPAGFRSQGKSADAPGIGLGSFLFLRHSGCFCSVTKHETIRNQHQPDQRDALRNDMNGLVKY